MPVLPCRSPAGLPRYAAGYSGMMELAASGGVLGGVVRGRGIPFLQRLPVRVASASAHRYLSPGHVAS